MNINDPHWNVFLILILKGETLTWKIILKNIVPNSIEYRTYYTESVGRSRTNNSAIFYPKELRTEQTEGRRKKIPINLETWLT